ncbi:MAG TPA: enoyl-CoA hydratase/isomerase family protein [Solirubrobacteraceae bacterium]|nr:enoyl-CoA hydratase/isomerase family protein [Solirubrobacteraceae bacterium]
MEADAHERDRSGEGAPPELATLTLGRDGAVGELVLNRPAKLNALSAELLDELVVAASWFDAQQEVRAVVVRGSGRAFSGGADLGGMAAPEDAAERRWALDRGRRSVEALAGMRALTVAAIHGHCVGGGVVLACACDIRIAAAGTRFSIPEVDLGIPLTWGGIPRLVRELGPSVTKDLVLTCRPFDAEEALRLRLVSRVVAEEQLHEAARAVAAKLASQPRYSLELTKRQVDAVAEEGGSTAQAFREAELLAEALRDEESLQAMARYLRARG